MQIDEPHDIRSSARRSDGIANEQRYVHRRVIERAAVLEPRVAFSETLTVIRRKDDDGPLHEPACTNPIDFREGVSIGRRWRMVRLACGSGALAANARLRSCTPSFPLGRFTVLTSDVGTAIT